MPAPTQTTREARSEPDRTGRGPTEPPEAEPEAALPRYLSRGGAGLGLVDTAGPAAAPTMGAETATESGPAEPETETETETETAAGEAQAQGEGAAGEAETEEGTEAATVEEGEEEGAEGDAEEGEEAAEEETAEATTTEEYAAVAGATEPAAADEEGETLRAVTAMPRLGIPTPRVPPPPGPALERAKEITGKTGKPPELHHAQVRDAVHRTTAGARDAQRQMVSDGEKLAEHTRLSIEQLAVSVGDDVAACIGNITDAVDATKEQVETAGGQYAGHIAEHGVLVGEELEQNRSATTTRIFDELQGGAEHIDEANRIIQSHFDENLIEAANKIEALPGSGTFEPIPNPHPPPEGTRGGEGEGRGGPASEGREGGGQEQAPAAGGGGSTSKTVAEAREALTEWLPEGARDFASEIGGAGLATYCKERSEPAIPSFLEPTGNQITEGQTERANALNDPSTRAQFAIVALGLTAPVAERHRSDPNETEQAAEKQEESNEEATLTGTERARKTIEERMNGVNKRLEETTKPKFIKNIRKSGRKVQKVLREQALTAESALIAAVATMADAYRDVIRRLKKLLPDDRFLDARGLVPKIKAALTSAQHLRDSHLKTIGQQSSDTIEQLEKVKREQVANLRKMTGQFRDSLADVLTQTRFDLMLFAEQMTGEVTAGRDAVVEAASGYADRMAENILRLAGRNDDEAVPFLASLSASFLNGQIGAAQGWQHQVVRGHEDQLKSGSGAFVSIWQGLVTDLNRRSREIDAALPDSGTSVEGALASAATGGVMGGGPVGALAGLGAYYWSKDPDEDEVIAALGDLPLPGPPALEEVFQHAGFGALKPRIEDTMGEPEKDHALGLLSMEEGERAAARAAIAQESTEWFGYNRAARESALRGLTPTERAELSTAQIESLRDALTDDLDGSEETISLAYLDNNRELALAARIQEARRNATREGNRGVSTVAEAERRGDQAAVDMVASIEQLARTELAFEHAHITGERLGEFTAGAFQEYAMLETPPADRPVGGFSAADAREFVINQLTDPRTVIVGYGEHVRVETVEMSPEAERYIRDALTHGGSSPEAQDSRAVYEVTRAREEGDELSETTQMRLTQALENPRLSDLNGRLDAARARAPSDPEEIARLEQQVAEEQEKHQERMARLAGRLGVPEDRSGDPADATEWLGEQVGELFAREGSQHARYGEELIERGRPTMVAGIALATDKWGTHEDLLLHTYRGRTQEEIDAVQQQWREEHPGEDLNEMLGIAERQWDAADYAALAATPVLGPVPALVTLGGRAGETSGDVAMQLQQLAQGPQTTDLDAVNMAGLRVDQQERGTGFLADVSMSMASETEVMNGRRERVGELIVAAAAARGEDVSRFRADPDLIFGTNGQLDADLRGMAFDANGNFRGDSLALHGLTHATGLAADNYQAEIDRQESILTTALTVLTIAVSIALMFVPGVNVVAAGILTAVIGGALTMGVKYGMRGERYGWEEAATDLAQTGIEAATAGIGGAMAGGLGRSGALFRAGDAMNKAFGKVGGAMMREAITGAISNAAQVAIQDDTFKDGTDRGIERLINGAVKGAAVGAVSAGISEKVGDAMDDAMAKGLREAGDLADTPMQRIGQALGPTGREMFKEGVSEALGSSMSEGVGILIDYANGDFKGSFGDALKRIGQAGLKDMVTSTIKAGVRMRNRDRFDDLMSAAREKGGDLTPQEARALRLAGISAGVMNYDTPLSEVRHEVEVGRQAQQRLPPELAELASTLNAQTLQQLMHGLDTGDFGTPKEKLDFIRGVADQIPGLDQREFLEALNRGMADFAEARAKVQAEQAAIAVQQKEARDALLAEVPGPARKFLRDTPIDGLDALPPEALKQAAAMIAGGDIDPEAAGALLRAAKAEDPDIDDVQFLQNLARAADTSRRAQNAIEAERIKQRRELGGSLPEAARDMVARLPDNDIRNLNRLIDDELPDSPEQRDALFRRAQKADPELTRDLFDQAVDGGIAQRRAEAEVARQERRQARMAQMENVPETHRTIVSALPEDALIELRLAQHEGSLSDDARHRLIEAALRETPDVDIKALETALDATVASRPDTALSRRQAARLRDEMLAGVPSELRAQIGDTPILRLSDSEFAALTRSDTGEAVTLILDGKPAVLIRESADPSVLREEGLHVLQRSDPEWAARVGVLDERTLAEWDRLPLGEQLALYRNKIAIEIDAHQRMIQGLESEMAGAMSAAERLRLTGELELARATLDALSRRQVEAGAIDEIRMAEIQSGLVSKPQWLDQPARLFAKAEGEAEAAAARAVEGEAEAEAGPKPRPMTTPDGEEIPNLKLVAVDEGELGPEYDIDTLKAKAAEGQDILLVQEVVDGQTRLRVIDPADVDRVGDPVRAPNVLLVREGDQFVLVDNPDRLPPIPPGLKAHYALDESGAVYLRSDVDGSPIRLIDNPGRAADEPRFSIDQGVAEQAPVPDRNGVRERTGIDDPELLDSIELQLKKLPDADAVRYLEHVKVLHAEMDATEFAALMARAAGGRVKRPDRILLSERLERAGASPTMLNLVTKGGAANEESMRTMERLLLDGSKEALDVITSLAQHGRPGTRLKEVAIIYDMGLPPEQHTTLLKLAGDLTRVVRYPVEDTLRQLSDMLRDHQPIGPELADGVVSVFERANKSDVTSMLESMKTLLGMEDIGAKYLIQAASRLDQPTEALRKFVALADSIRQLGDADLLSDFGQYVRSATESESRKLLATLQRLGNSVAEGVELSEADRTALKERRARVSGGEKEKLHRAQLEAQRMLEDFKDENDQVVIPNNPDERTRFVLEVEKVLDPEGKHEDRLGVWRDALLLDAYRPAIDDLAGRLGIPRQDLIRQLLGGLEEDGIPRFDGMRRRLRARQLDAVMTQGSVQDQLKMLREMLDVQAQGKGDLFEGYQKRRLGMIYVETPANSGKFEWIHPAVTVGTIDKFAPNPQAQLKLDIEGSAQPRTADSAMEYRGGDPQAPAELEQGKTYLVDMKAGPTAFQDDQFLRYVRALIAGKGEIGGPEQRGLIYIADTPGHAQDALARATELLSKALIAGEIEVDGVKTKLTEADLEHIRVFFATYAGTSGTRGGLDWEQNTWLDDVRARVKEHKEQQDGNTEGD